MVSKIQTLGPGSARTNGDHTMEHQIHEATNSSGANKRNVQHHYTLGLQNNVIENQSPNKAKDLTEKKTYENTPNKTYEYSPRITNEKAFTIDHIVSEK